MKVDVGLAAFGKTKNSYPVISVSLCTKHKILLRERVGVEGREFHPFLPRQAQRLQISRSYNSILQGGCRCCSCQFGSRVGVCVLALKSFRFQENPLMKSRQMYATGMYKQKHALLFLH